MESYSDELSLYELLKKFKPEYINNYVGFNQTFRCISKIDGFEIEPGEYYIGDKCDVYVVSKAEFIKINNNSKFPYFEVYLKLTHKHNNKWTRSFLFHRVMANVFIKYQNHSGNDNTVDHISPTTGRLLDNIPDNLQFLSMTENNKKHMQELIEQKDFYNRLYINSKSCTDKIFKCFEKGIFMPKKIIKELDLQDSETIRKKINSLKTKVLKGEYDKTKYNITSKVQRFSRGEDCSKSRLTNSQVEKICELLSNDIVMTEDIAPYINETDLIKLTGIIRTIYLGEHWSHISEKYNLNIDRIRILRNYPNARLIVLVLKCLDLGVMENGYIRKVLYNELLCMTKGVQQTFVHSVKSKYEIYKNKFNCVYDKWELTDIQKEQCLDKDAIAEYIYYRYRIRNI